MCRVNVPLSAALPLPGVELTVDSDAGTGREECLNHNFDGGSGSLQCVADVVSNLVGAPEIKLMRDGIDVDSTTGVMLTYSLPDTEAGSYTCSVCINVPAADIQDHCSMTGVMITRNGKIIHVHFCLTLLASSFLLHLSLTCTCTCIYTCIYTCICV